MDGSLFKGSINHRRRCELQDGPALNPIAHPRLATHDEASAPSSSLAPPPLHPRGTINYRYAREGLIDTLSARSPARGGKGDPRQTHQDPISLLTAGQRSTPPGGRINQSDASLLPPIVSARFIPPSLPACLAFSPLTRRRRAGCRSDTHLRNERLEGGGGDINI